jgi:hypothetical protein
VCLAAVLHLSTGTSCLGGEGGGGMLARECLQRRVLSVIVPYPNPIPNLSTCPSISGAREPISVAIPFDLLRKNGAMSKR